MLAITAGVAFLAFSSAHASAAGTGSISGTVTDSMGGPLKNVCVYGHASNGNYFDYFDITDSNGDYTVDGMETDNYRIEFQHCRPYDNNVLTEFYDDVKTLAQATPIAVTDGSDVPGIDAQMATGGSISGKVTDPNGAPLYAMCVELFGSDGTQLGYPRITDRDGTYAITGLVTGDYRLKFSECLFHTRTTVFHSNKETLAQATPISVTQGTEVPNIDAQLSWLSSYTTPDTVIDAGPSGTITTDRATFSFSSSDPGDTAKFQCKIDSEAYADCTSPKTFSSLSEGAHTVSFRAEDPDGNQDQSPATRTFTVSTAKISKVTVKGPAKARIGKTATYKVKITNSGNGKATGVGIKVRGRGVSFNASVGKIPAGAAKTVKVNLKPKKSGKVKLTFKVTSANAGGKSTERRITVEK